MASANATSGAPIWAIGVFAHNEAHRIRDCLESILAAKADRDLRITVLANGCSDRTVEVVHSVAQRHRGVAVAEIEMGDKANAWNLYVHEVSGDAECYFFMDGDVRMRPSALTSLSQALARDPAANAAAALPASGRDLGSFRQALVRERGLAGNLYALSARFVDRIRHRQIRLPIGLIGDDSLVGALAKWDLDMQGTWNNDRVVPAEGAEFLFDSVSLANPRDWRLYWRRLIRYKIRAYQMQLLRDLLRQKGLAAMPSSVADLYQHSDLRSLRWFGYDAPISLLALLRMRRTSSP